MKVLIEIDESRFHEGNLLSIADPDSGAKIVGTSKDMTLDTVFSKKDVWELVSDPSLCFDYITNSFFSEDKIKNIELYGREAFLESVIARLNHRLDADEVLSWTTVSIVAKDAYNDLVADFVESEENQNSGTASGEISLDGFRKALDRFSDSAGCGKCGPWKISAGDFSVGMRISYNDVLVSFASYGDFNPDGSRMFSLHRPLSNPSEPRLSDKMFSEICDMVHSDMPNYHMASREQKNMQAKAQGR